MANDNRSQRDTRDNRNQRDTRNNATPRVPSVGGATVVVELLRPTRYDLHHGVVLLPGENTVDAEAWAKNATHKMVRQYIDAGHIVERGEGTATPMTDRLDTVSIGRARLWIDNCEDEEQLMRWKAGETRNEVAQALSQRIEMLRNRTDADAGNTQRQEGNTQPQGGAESK